MPRRGAHPESPQCGAQVGTAVAERQGPFVCQKKGNEGQFTQGGLQAEDTTKQAAKITHIITIRSNTANGALQF